MTNTLAESIRRHLASYQLPTIRVQICEPRDVGIQVDCQVVRSERSEGTSEQLKKKIDDALTHFLSPLPLSEDGYEAMKVGLLVALYIKENCYD